MDAAKSAKYLTSTLKGFNIEAKDAISVVDKLVSVDLVSATDAAGLAEAMSRTAKSADLAGISIDKLLGYLAVTGEVTQKNMSTIGESYKTILARMSDIKAEKLEFIDEDGTVEPLSDVETVLANLDIKLRDSNNEFRNFGIVLDEVGTEWKNYSSVQKAAISKAFAGVRQSENFKVLMENYDKATEYMNVAQNSSGNAVKKFDAYLDSIEAKTKSLQASFESLSIDSVSPETIGGIVEATTSLVNFLNKTNMVKGSLAGLTAVGTIKTFTFIATSIKGAALKLNEFNSALKLVKVGNIGDVEIQRLAQMTANLSTSQQKAVLSSKNLSVQQRISILTAQGLSEAEAKAALSAMGLATAEGAATTSTFTLSGALKGLWATLAANPLVLVFMAVSAGVSIFSSLKQKAEETRQASLDAGNAAKDEVKTITDLYNAYQKVAQAYESNTASKDELKGATDDLLKALGVEQAEIDKLIERYGNLDAAINEVTNSALKKKIAELTSGYQASVDTLLNKTKDGWLSTFSLLDFTHGNNTAFADTLSQKGLISSSNYGSGGGVIYLGDNTNLNGIIEIYEKLIKMRQTLDDAVSEGAYTRDELAESGLYKSINEKINSFESEYVYCFSYSFLLWYIIKESISWKKGKTVKVDYFVTENIRRKMGGTNLGIQTIKEH